MLASVGILAALLLPALEHARSRVRATRCMNNVRQLQAGWMLFIEDHDDQLPPNDGTPEAGRNAAHPSWVAGWLRTARQSGDHSDGTNTDLLVGAAYAPFGSIGTYVLHPDVYRCPGDRSGRVRSMSMNGYLNGRGIWQSPEWLTFTRLDEIPHPAHTWVFMDEREDSINDGYFAVDMTARHVLLDYPASYHDGAGTVSFADGHVERHRWIEPTTSPPLHPGVHLSLLPRFTSATDRDLQWLTERTTMRTP
ncbi:MAG: hypothetical protein JXQ71_07005 [Verrucomicrobia bacterium]|nr:hypothetical protein [Verrucomicrobiota bacterium]